MTDHVCGFAPSDQTTSGLMTLSTTEHMTGALIVSSTLLMNIPAFWNRYEDVKHTPKPTKTEPAETNFSFKSMIYALNWY